MKVSCMDFLLCILVLLMTIQKNYGALTITGSTSYTVGDKIELFCEKNSAWTNIVSWSATGISGGSLVACAVPGSTTCTVINTYDGRATFTVDTSTGEQRPKFEITNAQTNDSRTFTCDELISGESGSINVTVTAQTPCSCKCEPIAVASLVVACIGAGFEIGAIAAILFSIKTLIVKILVGAGGVLEIVAIICLVVSTQTASDCCELQECEKASIGLICVGVVICLAIFRSKPGPPGIPVIQTENNVDTSTSILVRWSKPSTGGSKILKYSVKYQKVDVKEATAKNQNKGYELKCPVDTEKTEDNIKIEQYELSNLVPGSYYQVTVIAHNINGSSNPGSKIIKTLEGPPGILTENNVDTSTSILVRWRKPSTGGSEILEYSVKCQRVTVKQATAENQNKGYELECPIDEEYIIANIKNEQYELKNLLPGNYYQVTVIAHYTFGSDILGSKIIKTLVSGRQIERFTIHEKSTTDSPNTPRPLPEKPKPGEVPGKKKDLAPIKKV